MRPKSSWVRSNWKSSIRPSRRLLTFRSAIAASRRSQRNNSLHKGKLPNSSAPCKVTWFELSTHSWRLALWAEPNVKLAFVAVGAFHGCNVMASESHASKDHQAPRDSNGAYRSCDDGYLEHRVTPANHPWVLNDRGRGSQWLPWRVMRVASLSDFSWSVSSTPGMVTIANRLLAVCYSSRIRSSPSVHGVPPARPHCTWSKRPRRICKSLPNAPRNTGLIVDVKPRLPSPIVCWKQRG